MAVTDDEIKEPINALSQIELDMEHLETSNTFCFRDGFGATGDNRSGSHTFSTIYHGEWPIKNCKWNTTNNNCKDSPIDCVFGQDTASIISFNSSVTSSTAHFSVLATDQNNMKAETDKLASPLLSIYQTSNGHIERNNTLCDVSEIKQNCTTQNNSNCMPQQTHNDSKSVSAKDSAMLSDRNREANDRINKLVLKTTLAQPYDKSNNREMLVLRLLVHIRKYCCRLLNLNKDNQNNNLKYVSQQVCSSVANVMKLSFDEEYRYIICKLGGLQAIAHLIQTDKEIYGCTSDQYCVMIRRYAGMALTNLTYNDGANKSVLCSIKPFMKALVAQLHSPSEDLRQVTASVLRNLSWKADSSSKQMLRDVGAVKILMKAAMTATKESTLKSILSALWNLSAHCSSNKADICVIEGALAFLVTTLTYKSNSKTLTIVENAGGILRNISSHIAIQNDYRTVLRKHSCLQVLLCHLKSPSLTVVSNACGTLWNLSARNPVDQRTLWEMGAVSMLQKLVNSKHKMISMGSSAALKNLLSSKPPGYELQVNYRDCHSSSSTPSLHARKQKALDAEVEEDVKSHDTDNCPKTHYGNQTVHNGTSRSRNLPQSYRNSLELSNNIKEEKNTKMSLNNRKVESPHCSMVRNLNAGHRYLLKMENGDDGVSKLNAQSPYATSEIVLEKKTLRLSRFCNPDNAKPTFVVKADQSKDAVNYFNSTELEGETVRTTGNNQNKPLDIKNTYPSVSCYSNLVKKFEKIDQDNYTEPQEQPINYSLKYDDETSKTLPGKVFVDSSLRYVANSKIPQPKSDVPLIQKAHCSFKNTASCDMTLSKSGKVAFPTNKSMSNCVSMQTDFLYNTYIETDLDNLDQPIDFSKKYYTDLDDQPIDFSKKYQEQDVSEECAAQETENTTFLSDHTSQRLCHGEDSVKVYCTEDTPLNFSSASSLTDLREIMLSGESSINSFSKNKSGDSVDFELCTTKSSECDVEEIGEICCNILRPVQKKQLSKDISEVKLIPQKNLHCNEKEGKTVTFGTEVDYAEETPLMFSRCSSLGSLSSFEQQSIHDDRSSVISDFSRCTSGVVSPSELPDSPGHTVPPSPLRKKAVFVFPPPESSVNHSKDSQLPDKAVFDDSCHGISTFDEVKKVFIEEGTPVQFSTTSSLSSLSFDNESGHSKEPSVKNVSLNEDNNCNKLTVSPCPAEDDRSTNSEHGTSTFDEVKVFAEEGTPVQFSATSSLSSFSFGNDSSHSKEHSVKNISLSEEEYCHKMTVSPCHREDNQSTNSEDNVDLRKTISTGSSEDTDDSNSDLLAECISFGMPTMNKAHKNKQNESLLSRNSICNIRESVNTVKTDCTSTKKLVFGNEQTSSAGATSQSALPCKSNVDNFEDDCIKIYRTEGTPNLSHSTSFSDLSILSFGDNKNRNKSEFNNSLEYHSDSSSVCDDDDGLLLQCIKSGMPSSKMSNKLSTQGSSTESLHRKHLNSLTFGGTENENKLELDNSQEYNSDSSSACDDDDDDDNGLLLQCIQSGMPSSKISNGASSQGIVRDRLHRKQHSVPSYTEGGKNGSKCNNSQEYHFGPNLVGDHDNNNDVLLNCIKSSLPSSKLSNEFSPHGSNAENMHRKHRSIHSFDIKSENKPRFYNSQDCHSDSCSASDDDEDNGLLMQCIKSGMPRSEKPNRVAAQAVSVDKAFVSNSVFTKEQLANSNDRPAFGFHRRLKKNSKMSDLTDIDNAMKCLTLGNQRSGSFSSALSYEQHMYGKHHSAKRRMPAKHSTNESKLGSIPNGFVESEKSAVFPQENSYSFYSHFNSRSFRYCDDVGVVEERRPLSDGSHSRSKDNPYQMAKRENYAQVETYFQPNKSEFEISLCSKGSFDTSPDGIMKPYDSTAEDHHKYNLVEGTPVCFSRCSSLSSLSVESFEEPSSTEKALLEECIRFGLPKGKMRGSNATKK